RGAARRCPARARPPRGIARPTEPDPVLDRRSTLWAVSFPRVVTGRFRMVRTTWRAATLALLATLAACAEDPLDEMPDAAQVGTLERAEIDTTIRSHLHGIRACTHRALVSGEAEEGEIRVRFVIAADGTVSSAKVAS